LAAVLKFKVALEAAGLTQPIVNTFKMPIPIAQKHSVPKSDFGALAEIKTHAADGTVLGKRGEPEKIAGATKKSGPMDAFFFLQPESKKQKVIQKENSNSDEYSSSEEGKWFAQFKKCQECGNK